MNLFQEGKDGKSSHAARTVDGGAEMMMLVLIEGIARDVEMWSVQEGSMMVKFSDDAELWLWADREIEAVMYMKFWVR
jgi:hypothetical protein